MIEGDINGVVDSSGEWLNILLAILIFGNLGFSSSPIFSVGCVSGLRIRIPSSLTVIFLLSDGGEESVPAASTN